MKKNILSRISSLLYNAFASVRGFLLKVTAWQRKSYEVRPMSVRKQECLNCHTVFTGDFCPRCGQSATVSRFTFRHALMKTLEVWGMGNRSLPRTLWHLVYRPGYVIRDYLSGHHMPYFPPVKMLFLVTAAYVFVSRFMSPEMLDNTFEEQKQLMSELYERINAGASVSDGKRIVVRGLYEFNDRMGAFTDFFRDNQALELMLTHSILAVVTMFVFRNTGKSRLNLTECFFSQIFMASQLLLVSIVCIVVTGGSRWADNMYVMPTWLLLFILFYDYKQLYGLSLGRTAINTVKVFFGWILSMMLLLMIFMCLSVAVYGF